MIQSSTRFGKNMVVTSVLLASLLGLTACESANDRDSKNNTVQQPTSVVQNNNNGNAEQSKSQKQKNNGYAQEPEMAIDVNKQYIATVQTNKGIFEIELLPKVAPKTVNNFVFLAREGYYNDIIFHRVIKEFMIQTGDPLGQGFGGPGYKFDDELGSGISYEPGVVAMANSGPNTNGSQFFICSGADCKQLDMMPNYTIFGKVSKGMDIIQAIASVEVGQSPSGEVSSPAAPVLMENVTIAEK